MRVAALLLKLSGVASLVLLFSAGYCLAADDIRASYEALKQGHPDQALNKVSEFLSTHPKDAQARLLKGVVLVELGKTAEAIQVFTAMTEEMPELPEPYNNLAVIYASQGDYEKARTLLELALHTHPSYGTAHENLADVYAKIATKSYEKALQNDKLSSPKPKLIMLRSLSAPRSLLAANSPALTKSGIAAPETATANASSPTPTPAPAKAPAAAAVSSATVASAVAPKTPVPAPLAAKAKDTTKADAREASPASVPYSPPAPDTSKEDKAITENVKSWAAAWSAKDADQYLSFYGKDFKTPKGESTSEWEKSRRDRLTNATSIRVEVQDISVNMLDSDTASVTFKQKYHSGQIKSSHHKVLVLKREAGRWVIVEERARN
jgi:ketosteroid isomerase-like protein